MAIRKDRQKRVINYKIQQAGYEFIHKFGRDSVFKQCTCCLEWKWLYEYPEYGPGFLGLRSFCKKCYSKYSMAHNSNCKYSLEDFKLYCASVSEGKVYEGPWKLMSTISSNDSYELIQDPEILEMLDISHLF